MPFTEKKLVEDYLIERLIEKGWSFFPADELQRESLEEPLLIPNLARALEKINQPLEISNEEIIKVLNELKLTTTGHEGSKKILNFLRFGVPIKFEKDKIVKYVQLFDFAAAENNEFIVTRQAYFHGKDIIRTDILLYINGIPLVDIECKNPANISESWLNAYNQIKDYEKIVPELYKYIQIGVAAESTARYFPIVPWQGDVKTYEWKEENKDAVDATIDMLSGHTLLDIIRNFLFWRIEFGNATKVITRYMQYRAANKIVDRVLSNLDGEDDKNKGLIWHWQGSGKTLTMIFAAHKLYYLGRLKNPSIYFIVDRIELENQLNQEFSALDMFKPEIIGSISDLKNLLKVDDYRSKRGVFIVLIHKFRPAELTALQKEIELASKHKETVMTRENIIAFVDEGHRTQYGLLAAQMRAILRSAFFFAFTGTPIAKMGRDTFIEFSHHPEETYLDRYFITDSIKDGFTVKIVYQPRLEKEVHLDKKSLEVFLESPYEELPEEIREDVEAEVRKRLNTIKVILENPERIKLIAADIADHFKENLDGKFKAMVVAGSKLACTRYKAELDRYFPAEYSEVVMTVEGDRRKPIQSLVAETRDRYGGRDFADIRKLVRDNFREEEYPKILIVTEMLLTGFDAPLLQVMYLDKLLKEHRLLQAVARTNRPYKDLKEAGIIIDYVGILKEFKRAFEMYSEEDLRDVLVDYDGVRGEFLSIIQETLSIFGGMKRGYERKDLLRAIEILTAEDGNEKTFVEKYKALRKLFELLGPDQLKLTHVEEYKWLSAVYAYYLKVVVQKPVDEAVVQKFYKKTIKFIHKATEIEKLEKDLPAISFDEKYLEKLEEKVKGREEKAANILFTLNRFILVDRHRNPIYESVVEKVERLLDLWKEKTRDYERIYLEGVIALQEIDKLTKRKGELGFSDLEYSVLLELEKMLTTGDDFVPLVREFTKSLMSHLYPGWQYQTTARKEVEREIRGFVRRLKSQYRLSMEEMNALHDRLTESVRNYGTSGYPS